MILKLDKRKIEFSQFIGFWSNFYDYSATNDDYNSLIKKKSFTEAEITSLFRWKNGMNFENHIKKQSALNMMISALPTINELKQKFDLTKFNNEFHSIGAIWKIFLLHIIKPTEFPIFDRYVYLAHQYIKTGKLVSVPNSHKTKLDYYFNVYQPKFKIMKKEAPDSRQLDKALWAFGRYLTTPYFNRL